MLLISYKRKCVFYFENFVFAVLNSGKSVQVSFILNEDKTTLSVLTEGQKFESVLEEGISLISENEYTQYPYGQGLPTDLVKYQSSYRMAGEPYLLV